MIILYAVALIGLTASALATPQFYEPMGRLKYQRIDNIDYNHPGNNNQRNNYPVGYHPVGYPPVGNYPGSNYQTYTLMHAPSEQSQPFKVKATEIHHKGFYLGSAEDPEKHVCHPVDKKDPLNLMPPKVAENTPPHPPPPPPPTPPPPPSRPPPPPPPSPPVKECPQEVLDQLNKYLGFKVIL